MNTIDQLKKWEKIINENQQIFIDRFCNQAWIVTNVSWSSESIRFVFILKSGQHIGISVEIKKWFEFLEYVKTP